MSWLLSLVIFLPLAGALVALLIPREEAGIARAIGFTASLLTFLVSLVLLGAFEPGQAGFQLEQSVVWVESLGLRYHVGVDGISLWLVLLTTFLTPITLLSAQRSVAKKVREFVVAMLLLETGMLGAFLALDMFLFYVFWEVMLIPMYFIIGIWGGDRRVYASIKFVIYTMVGSLLMLVAIIYLYAQHKQAGGVWSFEYADLTRLVLPVRAQVFCFLAFGLAFAIKVPLVPFHTWLPDAHVEAPTAGSVILAGVLLKFGTYGFLRFAIPMFPWATAKLAPYIAIAAVVGVIYGSLVAYAQTDVKKLIAYSSVAHLAFVMLGLMSWNERAIHGALFIMLAHGLYSGGLFLAVGVIYERRHTRRMDEFGGLWARMPVYGAFFLIVTLASVGLPGLVGFVGEFLVLSGTFSADPSWKAAGLPALLPHPQLLAVLATTGVILGAVYMLWMFQKVMFGPLSNPRNRELGDLTVREKAVFVPVLVMIFWMGLYPSPFLSRMTASVERVTADYKRGYEESLRVGLGAASLLQPSEPREDTPAPTEQRRLGPLPNRPGTPGQPNRLGPLPFQPGVNPPGPPIPEPPGQGPVPMLPLPGGGQ
jgi:NADH-quinone oxidoreductase subunit M